MPMTLPVVAHVTLREGMETTREWMPRDVNAS